MSSGLKGQLYVVGVQIGGRPTLCTIRLAKNRTASVRRDDKKVVRTISLSSTGRKLGGVVAAFR